MSSTIIRILSFTSCSRLSHFFCQLRVHRTLSIFIATCLQPAGCHPEFKSPTSSRLRIYDLHRLYVPSLFSRYSFCWSTADNGTLFCASPTALYRITLCTECHRQPRSASPAAVSHVVCMHAVTPFPPRKLCESFKNILLLHLNTYF